VQKDTFTFTAVFFKHDRILNKSDIGAGIFLTENKNILFHIDGSEFLYKDKVIPLQARCGPEVGYRYSSTLP